MKELSIVIITKNEEKNIGRAIESVKKIADEIIVIDEKSTDKTKDIAKSKGAKVYIFVHKKNFHETKQYGIEKASGDWILLLDADEEVSNKLAKEIKKVLQLNEVEKFDYQKEVLKSKNGRLFKKHQRLLYRRDGMASKEEGDIRAYFIPRRNYFLGKPLNYSGVYPDGVIRLFKNGAAEQPAKSVHEQIKVDGQVGWLQNDLNHYDSPTLRRYLVRLNRYTDLHAKDLERDNVSKNIATLFYYSTLKPLFTFFKIYFRHRAFKDGIRGFLWAFFSASHFPIAYYKYFVHT